MNHVDRLINLFLIFFLLIPLIFISCGEENISGNSFQQSSSVPLKITIDLPLDEEVPDELLQNALTFEEILDLVATISVLVEGDFPTIFELFNVGEQIVVFVQPGPASFTIALLNAQGQALCQGNSSIIVVAGEPNEVTIECEVVDEVCDDNTDNNGDGNIDCEEDSCAGSQCDGTNTNVCIDNECQTAS